MSFILHNSEYQKSKRLVCLLRASAAALLLTVTAALLPQVADANTIVVTPSNLSNWSFDNRDGNGTLGANPTGNGAFVNGPATPPLGTGSANLSTGNGTTGGDGTAELRNTGYSGVLLSSITALGYSTFNTLNNGQQFPYFGLMISTTGGSVSDDIIFFEPPYQTPSSGNPGLPNQGVTAMNTWQSWNALAGGWWDNLGNATPGTGVKSLADLLALFPNATIVNSGGLGGVRFNVGFASPEDRFNGYVDAFTIGINNQNTTYDFEVSAVPEPSTWAMMLIGFACLGYFSYRRSQRSLTA